MSELTDLVRRIEELESQVAFQDELHGRLNDVVARQDREIADLRMQLQDLAARLREVGEALPGAAQVPADEVPPHY